MEALTLKPTFTYHVGLPDPASHEFEVGLEVRGAPTSQMMFRMPLWIRGSYLIRDMPKHVSQMQASRDGRPVEFERLDKATIRIPEGSGDITLSYRVHAFDPSVRKAFMNAQRGFFNGTSLFYCPVEFSDEPFNLNIRAPVCSGFDDWKSISSMAPVNVDARGFGQYRAASFEDLIDHPFELGPFRKFDFEVDSIPHALVISGRVETDFKAITDDLKKICSVERQMFGHDPELDEYLFLTNVVSSGYGGLEHRASTALICSRNDLLSAGRGVTNAGKSGCTSEYRQFLGLCSHEYFHLWNVKRITGESFAASDLNQEAYTRDLWHYEGVTSYYDDLFLLRAGIVSADEYLDVVSETATRLERSPARLRQTLAEASFETWIKFYQPDENSPNANTNYYGKGALVALCLDLILRRDSQVTLDEVMREAWQRHGKTGIPVPEGGLEAIAGEVSGINLSAFFDRALRSVEELPLAELLADFGVRATLRPVRSVIDDGGRNSSMTELPLVGWRFRPGTSICSVVLDQTPAKVAGLSAGDEIIAIDGMRLQPNQWPKVWERLIPDQPVELSYFRGDELHSATLVPSAPRNDTWTMELEETAEDAALARRKAWLGA